MFKIKNKILIILSIISILTLLLECNITIVTIGGKILSLKYIGIFTKANNYFYQGE